MPARPYGSLYERLIANTAEPDNEQACWTWASRLDRWGYGQINVYVPGLGRNVTMKAHIALYCWHAFGARTADELFLAYVEQVSSGLHLDHACRAQWCIRPDHLEPVTPSENMKRRSAAKRLAQTCSTCYS